MIDNDFLYKKGLSYALYILERKDVSINQLKEKLSNNYDENTINRIVERLVELDLLNDLRFSQKKLSSLINTKKLSLKSAKYELKRLGVDSNTIEDASFSFLDSENIDESELELNTAISFIKSKYRDLDDEKTRRRAFSALQRKGISYDVAKSAINRCFSELDDIYD